MNTYNIKKGDTIGIIAPSRPLWNITKEVEVGLQRLEKAGFVIKKSENLDKHFYYSAGTIQDRCNDLHDMFLDKDVKAILCATGGSSSVDLLRHIDFDIIKNNPKPFIGYSDITTLLFAIEKNMSGIAIHGPNAYEISYISDESFRYFVHILINGKLSDINIPQKISVLKHGKGCGDMIGGNITLINSLLASDFMPDLSGKIIFWEEIGESPAMLSFKLRELELSGKIKDIKGMIIGFLSNCMDKKYPEDNRYIGDIVNDIFVQYNFPIIQWNFFGHDIIEFYAIPFGEICEIDTNENKINFYHEKI